MLYPSQIELLNTVEVKRKFFHILSASFLIPYYYLDYKQYYTALICLTIIICIADIMRSFNMRFQTLCNKFFVHVLRETEKKQFFSGTSYMAIGFLCTYIITKNTSLYTAACFVLIFADSFAGLVGYFANSRKKLIHSIGFLFVALIVSLIVNIFHLHTDNQILGAYSTISNIIIACLITTFIEHVSRYLKINDNMSIPISFAICIKLLNYLNLNM
ncbi:MAG: hypothetical protein U1E31_03340 [Rickettsiales bacterium]